MTEGSKSRNVRKVFLLTTALWSLGWYWKILYYLKILGANSVAPPQVSLLPAAMSDYRLALGFYLLPVVGILVVLVRWSRERALMASGAMVVGALGCMGHYQFYNDATFVTSFWVALWLFWLAWNSEREDQGLIREARGLAKGTVALIFLGGAVGKFTGTYWSGEVLHDIYFQQKDYFIYNFLRESWTAEQVEQLAILFSRMAILGEVAVVVAALVLSYRHFAILVVVTVLSMVLISTPYLFSVMGAVVGLMGANLFWGEQKGERLAPGGRSD